MARSPEERIEALVDDIDHLTADLTATIAQMNALLTDYRLEKKASDDAQRD